MKITDGSVYATGYKAIGCGKSISNVVSNDGTLKIYDGAKVAAGLSESSVKTVKYDSREKACKNKYAAITPCTPHSFTKYPADKITGTTHTSVCAYCGTEGTTARHVYENDGFCVCGKQGTNYTAAVATAPEAKALTYNGAAQELVEAGTATNGTMQYTLERKRPRARIGAHPSPQGPPREPIMCGTKPRETQISWTRSPCAFRRASQRRP